MSYSNFEAKIFSLTETEKVYLKQPELAKRYYQQAGLICDDNGVYDFDELAINRYLETHKASLLEGFHENSSLQQIIFNKQSRFAAVPPHRHQYIEMFYLYAGTCQTTINNEVKTLSAGDVCIMDTQVVHSIEPLGKQDILINCIMPKSYFNASFIERLANSGQVARFLGRVMTQSTQHDSYLLFETQNHPLIRDLFEKAIEEFLFPGLCSLDVLDSYLTLIFIQLARIYQESKENDTADHRPYITTILKYLEEHTDSCTLEILSDKFNYNPVYLSRLLKQSTGLSFKALITENRLKHASFLLKNTTLPINTIASDCGWSNQKQFYKKFKEKYGQMPSEFRKSH